MVPMAEVDMTMVPMAEADMTMVAEVDLIRVAEVDTRSINLQVAGNMGEEEVELQITLTPHPGPISPCGCTRRNTSFKLVSVYTVLAMSLSAVVQAEHALGLTNQ